MKTIGYFISAFLLATAVACNTPEDAADVNNSDKTSDHVDEGVNPTKEDNTDVETMEDKYKDSDEDLVKDSL
tara:strand:+ start:109 stop:324 length:216 start_codon:yes stop_codon:yes gene_type:complete